jgi:formylmethanofuran:tetrahydromethanopterin formyltransferase
MTHRVTTVFSGLTGAPYFSNMFFADADAVQEDINAVAAFWTAINDQIVNDLTWTVQADVATISESSGQITSITSGSASNGGGTYSGEVIPFANQGLVSWITDAIAGGRRVRGRTYIPGLGIGGIEEGFMTTTMRTDIASAATSLISDSDTVFGVYSRTHQLFTPATSSSVWNQWAVMRSRRD